MKRLSFLVLALFIVAGSAHAQRRDDRRDNRNIIRISVGDDKDDRDMLKRIARLERAVSDLQEKVYELQAAPVEVRQITCSKKFFSIGLLEAQGETLLQAKNRLTTTCLKAAQTMSSSSSMFCEEEMRFGKSDYICE